MPCFDLIHRSLKRRFVSHPGNQQIQRRSDFVSLVREFGDHRSQPFLATPER